jgi:hypothetical protein
MSNIAIKGGATGTAVFTIESPTTSTDRTLTLPDVTATVITDSAGVLNIGSGQVYKDASGNVGIGTSLPAAKLSVYGATENQIRVTDDAAYYYSIGRSSTQGFLTFYGSQAAATGYIFTGAAGERMRITSAGNLGIGTSAPGSRIDARTSGATVANFQSTAANGGYMTYVGGSTTYIGAPLAFLGTGTASDFGIVGSGANNFIFGTSSAEKMRIDSSGNLLVGTTGLPTAGTLGTAFQVGASIAGMATWTQRSSSTAASDHAYFYNPNGIVGFIRTTGSSTAYSTSSDYRLKEDWQPMTGASERVKALNPVNFAWKADGSRVDGFLAHEAAEVVPEAVGGAKDAIRDEEYEVTPAVEATYDEEGNELTPAVEAVMGTRSVPDYQGIDQSKLVPLLTAALQEALARIETLEADVATLKGAA